MVSIPSSTIKMFLIEHLFSKCDKKALWLVIKNNRINKKYLNQNKSTIKKIFYKEKNRRYRRTFFSIIKKSLGKMKQQKR